MTEPRIIDSNEALTLLHRVVKGKGSDFVYPDEWRESFTPGEPVGSASCVYFQSGQPRCIVGHVLHELGYRVEREHDRAGALNEFINTDAVRFSSLALYTLDVAQQQQDGGDTWGRALERATLAQREANRPDDDIGTTQRTAGY